MKLREDKNISSKQENAFLTALFIEIRINELKIELNNFEHRKKILLNKVKTNEEVFSNWKASCSDAFDITFDYYLKD